VVTFIALLFSLSSHVTLALFASILSFIAAFLTLIAFAIDIALYIIVHDRVQRLLDGRIRTVAAPGMAKPFFLSPRLTREQQVSGSHSYH
jgi:hypothetical protein